MNPNFITKLSRKEVKLVWAQKYKTGIMIAVFSNYTLPSYTASNSPIYYSTGVCIVFHGQLLIHQMSHS
jgi:hypothetical protein